MKLGQNFIKYFVHFWGNGVSRKNAFEIYWPLGSVWFCLPTTLFKKLSNEIFKSFMKFSLKREKYHMNTGFSNNRVLFITFYLEFHKEYLARNNLFVFNTHVSSNTRHTNRRQISMLKNEGVFHFYWIVLTHENKKKFKPTLW